MTDKAMLQWQYRAVLGELQQLQLHASDPSCPCSQADIGEYCIPKHALALATLASETAAMDSTNTELFFDLGEAATDVHEKTRGALCHKGKPPDVVAWSRKWRKKVEPLYYSCQVKLRQAPPLCRAFPKSEATMAALRPIPREQLPFDFDRPWTVPTSTVVVPATTTEPARKFTLFPFQAEGVAWLKGRSFALLADDMGLGKTPQAIHWGADNRPVLVVVPASLTLNWQREIETMWRPMDTTIVLDGRQDLPKALPDWVILSYGQLNRYLPQLRRAGFHALIVDEAHLIKNLDAQRTKNVLELVSPSEPKPGDKVIQNRLAVTGTPILNRPIELFALMVFLGVKQQEEYRQFMERYTEHKVVKGRTIFTGARNLGELHNSLSAFMLRRLKKDVLKQLPPKINTPLFVAISNRDEYVKAETDFLTWLAGKVGDIAALNASRAEIITKMNALRQLAAMGKVMPVCDWLKPCKDGQGKVIIFSSFTAPLENLSLCKPDSVIYHGAVSPADRQTIVDRFQRPAGPCFFLGTIGAAGVGITLTAANRVCFLDLPWTPGGKVQAEDRSHRIGQTQPVEIVNVLARGTIDERMLKLLAEKEAVIAQAIEGKQKSEALSTSISQSLMEDFLRRPGLLQNVVQYQADPVDPEPETLVEIAEGYRQAEPRVSISGRCGTTIESCKFTIRRKGSPRKVKKEVTETPSTGCKVTTVEDLAKQTKELLTEGQCAGKFRQEPSVKIRGTCTPAGCSLKVKGALESVQTTDTQGLPGAIGEVMRTLERRGAGEPTSRTFAPGITTTTRYEFEFKVMDAGDLIVSHDPHTFEINPKYTARIQPRLRERLANQMQVKQIAARLDPERLLLDTKAIDTGTPIVGPDNLVECGNGRVMALMLAAKEYPANFELYRLALKNVAADMGLPLASVDKMKLPVLVRVRLTPVDRQAFAEECNARPTIETSSIEKARTDADKITPSMLNSLDVLEGEAIEKALRSDRNKAFVAAYLAKIPENERAGIIDARGYLSTDGIRRMVMGIFAATFKGKTGLSLASKFFEAIDETGVKNAFNGILRSLGIMAQAESLVASGAREPDLTFGEDLARTMEVFSNLRGAEMSVPDYLAQTQLFERQLTPFQESVLVALDQNARSAKRIGNMLTYYAQAVIESPPPGQARMIPGPKPEKALLFVQAVKRVAEEAEAEKAEREAKRRKGAGAEVGCGPACLLQPEQPRQPRWCPGIKRTGKDLDSLSRRLSLMRDKVSSARKNLETPLNVCAGQKEMFSQALARYIDTCNLSEEDQLRIWAWRPLRDFVAWATGIGKVSVCAIGFVPGLYQVVVAGVEDMAVVSTATAKANKIPNLRRVSSPHRELVYEVKVPAAGPSELTWEPQEVVTGGRREPADQPRLFAQDVIQDWQRTQAEYIDHRVNNIVEPYHYTGEAKERFRKLVKRRQARPFAQTHRLVVAGALGRGDPVPARVMADYPDLAVEPTKTFKVQVGDQILPLSKEALDRILHLTQKKSVKTKEEGFLFCKHGGSVVPGLHCQGARCSIRIYDCAGKSKAGSVHTHPLTPSWKPDWHIIPSNLDIKNTPGGEVHCVAAYGLDEMNCWHRREPGRPYRCPPKRAWAYLPPDMADSERRALEVSGRVCRGVEDAFAFQKVNLKEVLGETPKDTQAKTAEEVAPTREPYQPRLFQKRGTMQQDPILTAIASQVCTAGFCSNPAVKEPWQITQAEYGARTKIKKINKYVSAMGETTPLWEIREPGRLMERSPFVNESAARSYALGNHRIAVASALRAGKPVPAEVLADYPDLAAVHANPSEKPVCTTSEAKKLERCITKVKSRNIEAACPPGGTGKKPCPVPWAVCQTSVGCRPGRDG